MHILYHHRTAGDRVEYVHIMGMVNAFRTLGHTVEISSPPGCDPERKRPSSAIPGKTAPPQSGLRGELKHFARNAPNILFEFAEILYNDLSLLDCLLLRLRHARPVMIYERFGAYGLKYARPVAVLFIGVCLAVFVFLRLLAARRRHAEY